LFEALIVPHRSLTKRGLWWVVGSMSGLALLIGVRFWMLGAWPVLPFGVLEVGLVVLMLRMNARQARGSELILLNEAELRIVRTEPSGRRREKVLPAAWLSVSLQERDGRVPRLVLSRSGISEEIAAALGETEKRDLAECLKRALHRARNPLFDNPQLRELG
jgi:uncharacterized membrane protein